MRRSKLLLGAAVIAVAGASGAASAHVGVYVGAGGPWYYPVAPVPYYYAPAPVVMAPPPPAPDYIEQGGQPGAPDTGYPQGPGEAAPAAGPNGPNGPNGSNGLDDNGDTWYYCDASKTYYPYVKQCSSGWRAVPAQPAPEN